MQFEGTITASTPGVMIMPCIEGACGGRVGIRVVARAGATPSESLDITLRARTPDGTPIGDAYEAEPVEAPYVATGEGATFARSLRLPDALDGVGYVEVAFSTGDPSASIRVVASAW